MKNATVYRNATHAAPAVVPFVNAKERYWREVVSSDIGMVADEVLVQCCQSELPGNTRTFELLVERYRKRVYHFVYRLVGNVDDAEDLTQEIFLKVFLHLPTLEHSTAFSAWLFRIAFTSVTDIFKKNARRKQIVDIVSSAFEDDEGNTPGLVSVSIIEPEEYVLQGEIRTSINAVLKEIGQDQARLLLLRYVAQLSYDEIATQLEVNMSAMKMRLHRARQLFRERYSQKA